MPTLSIPATDGTGSFTAYHAPPTPSSTTGDAPGAVVLIQEIFGVNEAMREAAGLIADLGFHVIVPDLFWRIEPGIELTDRSKAEWDQAFALMKKFDQDRGVEDLQTTLGHARKLDGANGRAGTIGYCLGGRLAVMMAVRSDAEINVSYYGVGLDAFAGDIERVQKPLICHIAERDEFFPPDARQRFLDVARNNPHIRAHLYAGAHHAFARPHGNHWNGRAATIANGRTAEALAAALG